MKCNITIYITIDSSCAMLLSLQYCDDRIIICITVYNLVLNTLDTATGYYNFGEH